MAENPAQLTPRGRPRKEGRRLPTKKKLFGSPPSIAPVQSDAWSAEENQALVQFVLFYGDPQVWPTHARSSKFWDEAAQFIFQRTKSLAKRTGM